MVSKFQTGLENDDESDTVEDEVSQQNWVMFVQLRPKQRTALYQVAKYIMHQVIQN